MKKLATFGRSLVAISMIAFGVQHLAYLDFVTRAFPALPKWIPGQPFLSCVFGVFLIAAGIAIISGKAARIAALLLGAAILISFVVLYLPALIVDPSNAGLLTNAGKALALAGGSLLAAGSFPGELNAATNWRASVTNALEKFIPLGRFFLAAFMILAGVLHFIFAEFVTRMVPSWIPGNAFWTYFTGVALIAGGVGMVIPITKRLAAFLSGIMIFLWVVLLHIPRAAADLHNANETTALFEALAFSGTAFLVASYENKTKITL